MAFGDVTYGWYKSGSVTALDDGPHLIFGSFSGLSDLNNDDALHLQLHASGADFNLFPNNTASATEAGQRFTQDIDVYIDVPPLRAGDASQMCFVNLTAGDNAVIRWVAWRRRA